MLFCQEECYKYRDITLLAKQYSLAEAQNIFKTFKIYMDKFKFHPNCANIAAIKNTSNKISITKIDWFYSENTCNKKTFT